MSVPALAIVPAAPADEPPRPEAGLDPELLRWIRGRIAWEARLDQLRATTPDESPSIPSS